MLKLVLAGLFALLLIGGTAAAQQCPTFPYTLTNGSLADATQVMADLNTLRNCAALGTNPSFTGNVGIGTVSPLYQTDIRNTSNITQIHVSGTGNDDGGYILGYTSGNMYVSGGVAYNGSSWIAKSTSSSILGLSSGGMSLYSSTGSTVGSPAALNPIFTVTSNGDVGIGTTSPFYTLDVLSSIGVGAFARLNTSATANSWVNIGNASGSMNIGMGSNPYIYSNTGSFFIGADGAPTIFVQGDANGYVGIDTTSPSYPLHVNGTAYATGAAGALSDIRHKKDVSSLKDGALDNVMKLRPVSFQWKVPKDDGMKGRQMGFIAQEVEKVLPSAVLTQNDADKTKGLKYNEIVAVLTKALQEQQNQIKKLESLHQDDKAEIEKLRREQQAQIDSLKGELTALKSPKIASIKEP